MRIIITETQLKKVLLFETKQEIITDEYLVLIMHVQWLVICGQNPNLMHQYRVLMVL
jgi:hypothetical protein